MKRISLVLLVAAIIIGAIASSSYALDKGIGEEVLPATNDFAGLSLLLGLTQTESEKDITARVETEHSVIYAYGEVEVPDFLASDFDRVFEMAAGYFDLEAKDEKLVVWVADFDILQKIYPGQKGYPGGSPNTVAALYAPHFNYFFFTPRYMNDYYVAHELVHHFVDEHLEEVASHLPEVITQRNTSDLPVEHFIKEHEEEIATELPQIMIRQSLASLALQGV